MGLGTIGQSESQIQCAHNVPIFFDRDRATRKNPLSHTEAKLLKKLEDTFWMLLPERWRTTVLFFKSWHWVEKEKFQNKLLHYFSIVISNKIVHFATKCIHMYLLLGPSSKGIVGLALWMWCWTVLFFDDCVEPKEKQAKTDSKLEKAFSEIPYTKFHTWW